MARQSPIGQTVVQSSSKRSRQSAEYRAERERLEPYESIAREVIRLRMGKSLSQEVLAKRMGTTKSAISRLESGHHAPSVATLHKLAAACGARVVIGFELTVKEPILKIAKV